MELRWTSGPMPNRYRWNWCVDPLLQRAVVEGPRGYGLGLSQARVCPVLWVRSLHTYTGIRNRDGAICPCGPSSTPRPVIEADPDVVVRALRRMQDRMSGAFFASSARPPNYPCPVGQADAFQDETATFKAIAGLPDW